MERRSKSAVADEPTRNTGPGSGCDTAGGDVALASGGSGPDVQCFKVASTQVVAAASPSPTAQADEKPVDGFLTQPPFF